MKVKYFRPDIFELDNLNITPSVVQTGQLVQAYMPVDRTGNFNPFDMTYDPIPKVVKFNKSWESFAKKAFAWSPIEVKPNIDAPVGYLKAEQFWADNSVSVLYGSDYEFNTDVDTTKAA